MLVKSWLGLLRTVSPRTASRRHRDRRFPVCRLHVESLEKRDCPSGSYLLVADFGGDQVLRYDGTTGAFVDTFVPKHSGGLNQPYGVLFGPHDHDLFVSTGRFGGPGQLKAVLTYEGTTGAFRDEFTNGGDLQSPVGIIFGPDGNLYVGTGTGGLGGRIGRYDGTTGAFLGDFVTAGSGGLRAPTGLVFGPSETNPGRLDLYVSSAETSSVLRYDGITGAFLGEFVARGSGGLDAPIGLTFGPDGNLYVANSTFFTGGAPAVLRFQGPSGPTPGAFLDTFVLPGSGGLQTPWGLIFGPDGNNDGRFDLYVTNSELEGGSLRGKKGTVKRYDGVTGAFLDTFVPAQSGGLDDPQFLTFTETDPVTLAYPGGRLRAKAAAAEPVNVVLSADPVQRLLNQAIVRWQATGLDTSSLSTLPIRNADLPGAMLDQVVGNVIWLDGSAAGWCWFVDPTPSNDSELTTPGDQGEQGRMDLPPELGHEIGPSLAQDHEAGGLRAQPLTAGSRRAVNRGGDLDTSRFASDALFALFTAEEETAWFGTRSIGLGRPKR